MEYYLKTREECRQIVENSEAFYVTETVVEGCKVELYDYRLASINDFEQVTVTIEEDGKKLSFYHTELINGKMIGEMTEDEIEKLGFDFFESIKTI